MGAKVGAAVAAALGGALLLGSAHGAGDAVDAPPSERSIEAGFRMEGPAQVELVFGDIEAYKARINRFYELAEEMDRQRARFGAGAHRIVSRVEGGAAASCTDDLAAPFFRAFDAGRRFADLGEELELEYHAIKQLDGYGETTGLTPDLRWKVRQSRGRYLATLGDYREMRATMLREIGPEVLFRRCALADLLRVGAERERGETPETPRPPAPAPLATGSGEIVAASPATFFIDNRECIEPVNVFVDGELVGRVPAQTKAAFQTLSGRRTLCLVPGSSTVECGQRGTLRSANIHDGWSILMRCATGDDGGQPTAASSPPTAALPR